VVRGVQILAAIKGWKVTDSDAQGADIVVSGERRTAICIRNEADGRSLTPRLKALLGNVPRRDGAKLTLIRDARLPVSRTAVKAREHLKTLQERGCSLIEPKIEALAALDALASLLGDAKSGDLANQATALDGGAVLNWLKSIANELPFEPVKEFSDSVFVDEPTLVDTLQQDLTDLLALVRVVELESAATQLKQSPERVLSIARAEHSQCLVLDGPPTLILDMAGVAQEMEGRP
jgi:hypothetical protein